MKRFVIAALVAISTPAMAADQFDLICLGKITHDKDAPKDWANRYSIDLTAKRWCRTDMCPNTLDDIYNITTDQIVLNNLTLSDESSTYQEVNRNTGMFMSRVRVKNLISATVQAACERAEFTPFPARKF